MLRDYVSLPRGVHLLCLGNLVNRAGAMLVPFLTLYLRNKLGFGVPFATAAMSFFGCGALIAALIGGQLADQVGRRVVMLTALVGNATVLMLFGLMTRPAQIYAAVFAFALLTDMFRPASSAMLADLVPPERRAHAYGLMYVAVNLGFAIAPVVGGLLLKYSYLYLFWGDAATSLVFAILIAVAVPETLKRGSAQIAPAGSAGEPGGEDGPASSSAYATSPRGAGDGGALAALGYIVRDRLFIRFCVAQFFVTVVYMQAFTTLPLYLESLAIDAAHYGRIVAWNGLLIVVFQIPVTHWVSRYDRGRVIALGAIVTGAGFALHAVATTSTQFVLAVVVWTMGEMMQSSLLPAITSDLAPAPLRARYFGALSVSFAVSHMVAAPLGGFVLLHAGGRVLWLLTGLSGLTSAVMFASVRRGISRRAGGPAAATA